MKKILFILCLLISFNNYSQSILDLEQIEEKYPLGVGGYFSSDGKCLFDCGDFDSNSSDVDKIAYYSADYFEGDFMASNSISIQWYCDTNGKLLSYKRIRFSKYDENAPNPRRKSGKGKSFLVGTEIEFWKSGRIKNIKHY